MISRKDIEIGLVVAFTLVMVWLVFFSLNWRDFGWYAIPLPILVSLFFATLGCMIFRYTKN